MHNYEVAANARNKREVYILVELILSELCEWQEEKVSFINLCFVAV